MRIVNRAGWLAGMALAVLPLASAGARAQVGEPGAEGDDYASGEYGRIRDARGTVRIVRALWNDEQGVTDDGGVNSPIFPADAIFTESDQRVEVQLAGGTLVWLDGAAQLTFLALPSPHATVADNTVLQLSAGTVRLGANLGRDEEFRVDTPAASIYPLDDADLRVEVRAGGLTRVESRRGVIEVVSGGASVLVRSGMATEIAVGALPRQPELFNTLSSDGFDRYVELRKEAYQYQAGYAGSPEVYRELPGEVQPYYRELSAHGSWVLTDDYGYVWRPGAVPADWRPYHHGHWAYGPHGSFWVSGEPWGWAPYHYGRWTWLPAYGWCWSPGSVFAGAWVSWSWGSTYVGWSPLDYWGYPAYRSVWYHGYYDPFAWTFVSFNYVYYRDCARYYKNWDDVDRHVHGNAVVTRPPRVAPGRLAASESARASALREVRGDSGHRIAAGPRERPSASRSFRSVESRLTEGRGDQPAAPRRTLAAPAGRTRTVPLSQGGRVGARSAASGRERLPVARAPLAGSARPAQPAPGARTGLPPAARTPVASLQQGSPKTGVGASPGTADGVRDLYRRMSRPRPTREEPGAAPAEADDPPRAPAAKPSRTAPTKSGGSRPPGRSTRSEGSGGKSVQRTANVGAAPARPPRYEPAPSRVASQAGGPRAVRLADRRPPAVGRTIVPQQAPEARAPKRGAAARPSAQRVPAHSPAPGAGAARGAAGRKGRR